jgi:hypothetical protein
MLKRLRAYWKRQVTRKARRRKVEKKVEDTSRKQFEYLAKKGLRLPIYTL